MSPKSHPHIAISVDLTQMNRLWRWYGAATVLGRSESYLSRITAIAKEVVQGAVLSAKAKVAMERDCSAAANLGDKVKLDSSLAVKNQRSQGLNLEN